MNWVNPLYEHCVLPILEPGRYAALGARLHRYREREKRSAAELRAAQKERLLALLRHAYRTTRYYREAMDAAGVRLERLRLRCGIKVCDGLAKTQMIQESLDRFRVRYVSASAFSSSDLNQLREKLERYIGGGIDWECVRVNEIPRESSGKTRFCISRVHGPVEPPAVRA